MLFSVFFHQCFDLSLLRPSCMCVCVCVCVFPFSCMLQGTMEYDGGIQRYIETTNHCSSCDGNNAIIKTASPSPTTKVSKDLGFQSDDGRK